MKPTEQTTLQITRAINKIAQKFPSTEEANVMTDIHLRISQDSGEMVAFDDDENEINRCVIEDWIDNKDENFYSEVTTILHSVLKQMRETVDNLSILKPYSFVLEDDDKEHVAELYLVDDDIAIVGGELMEGLDKDLDDFFDNLMK
jgi:hypothetical protein